MEKFPVVFDQEAQDVLLRLGKIGEEEMRRSIKDAPTPFARIRSSVGLGPPKGRARTFRMYKSVGYMLRAGAKRLEIAVGYLKGPKQAYYKIQDGSDSPNGGFVNKWRFVGFGPGTSGPNAPSGFLFAPARPRITEGTHALRNARELMVKRSDKLFAEAERKIVRKSGGASSRRGRP
jgi:hypothetical protein